MRAQLAARLGLAAAFVVLALGLTVVFAQPAPAPKDDAAQPPAPAQTVAPTTPAHVG